EIFVEAESFAEPGGWRLDTQFIQEMGSPYLIAHGLGKPVADASTIVQVPKAGRYNVWVRTVDWVRRWDQDLAKDQRPGRFQISVGKQRLSAEFGQTLPRWGWRQGGVVDLSAGQTTIRLHDLTGFNGRVDCIYLSTATTPPPAAGEVLGGWRRQQLGLGDNATNKGPYDLVVVGGGYAGMGAALSASRMGCRVALVQNRGVLGGNGSSEVRVWAMGNIRRGRFPRVGEIIEEFCDHAKKSPGTYEEFGDDLKEAIVRAEDNIDLMLNHHAYGVEMKGDKIAAVKAFDVRSGTPVTIKGSLFCDCTGHGWIGAWAGAATEMTPVGRMGMSNMWAWDELETAQSYPQTPWALDLNMADFPYPRNHHGQWFWESGFDKDPLADAEGIRDWNLRAVYGAFNAMKNGDGAAKHKNAVLTWVAFIGGPRESRRLVGDVQLNENDIISKRDFPDGCVPTTWSIDLHYPKKQYAKKFPDNPFISIAVHDRQVDRSYGYPVPYRCFYSKNINNLFMAGRCISVNHEALGTVRVMKTCGMMGEVVGKAASICTAENCLPRDVYSDHLTELLDLLKLPGKARRGSVHSKIVIPADAMRLAGPNGPPSGLAIGEMKGAALDDADSKRTGRWSSGNGLKNHVMYGYRYAQANSDATATFEISAPAKGKYELRYYSQAHENRASNAPLEIWIADKKSTVTVDQKKERQDPWISVGQFDLSKEDSVKVVVGAKNADGIVHIDAIQLFPISP
ncbi:MAG: FAD-dependent oxidoreductase, partial [Planctomycetota bacterium]